MILDLNFVLLFTISLNAYAPKIIKAEVLTAGGNEAPATLISMSSCKYNTSYECIYACRELNYTYAWCQFQTSCLCYNEEDEEKPAGRFEPSHEECQTEAEELLFIINTFLQRQACEDTGYKIVLVKPQLREGPKATVDSTTQPRNKEFIIGYRTLPKIDIITENIDSPKIEIITKKVDHNKNIDLEYETEGTANLEVVSGTTSGPRVIKGPNNFFDLF